MNNTTKPNQLNIESPNYPQLPEFNPMGYRIVNTDLLEITQQNTAAQFMYKKYEVSFCQSLLFAQVLVTVLKDDKVVSHHFSVQSAIEQVDKLTRGY